MKRLKKGRARRHQQKRRRQKAALRDRYVAGIAETRFYAAAERMFEVIWKDWLALN